MPKRPFFIRRFFSFFLDSFVGITGQALAVDWVSKIKRRWFRPFQLYFLVGAIFILFFGLSFNTFRDKGLKRLKNISWIADRNTEKYAHAYIEEKRKPSPPPQDSVGPELIKKNFPNPQSASIKTYHQTEPQKINQRKIQKGVTPALEDAVLIEDVTFRIAQKGVEIVFVHSNRFFVPVIFALEGDRPRVVVDIRNISHIKKGLSKIDVGGELIKQIRSHYNRHSQTLRIVLDLNPSKNYITNQVFYETRNIYSLELIEENRHRGAIPKHKGRRPEEMLPPFFIAQEVEEKRGKEEISSDEIENDHALIASLIPIPGDTEMEKLKLRRTGEDLNERDVRETLYKYNFHSTCGGYNGNFCNPDGRFHNSFKNNNNGTVTDQVTGLMWEKSGSFTAMTWEEAKAYVRKLNLQNFSGYSDWRLPTLEELASLLESSWKNDGLFIETVFDKKQKSCWSADTHGLDKAWKANYHLGYIIDSPLTLRNSVRAVRSHNYNRSLSTRTKGLSQIATALSIHCPSG